MQINCGVDQKAFAARKAAAAEEVKIIIIMQCFVFRIMEYQILRSEDSSA